MSVGVRPSALKSQTTSPTAAGRTLTDPMSRPAAHLCASYGYINAKAAAHSKPVSAFRDAHRFT
eukprot:4424209-Pleurochrysis_carterae.AAC.1